MLQQVLDDWDCDFSGSKSLFSKITAIQDLDTMVVLLYSDVLNSTFWNVNISKCKIFLIEFIVELGNFKQKKSYTSKCTFFTFHSNRPYNPKFQTKIFTNASPNAFLSFQLHNFHQKKPTNFSPLFPSIHCWIRHLNWMHFPLTFKILKKSLSFFCAKQFSSKEQDF